MSPCKWAVLEVDPAAKASMAWSPSASDYKFIRSQAKPTQMSCCEFLTCRHPERESVIIVISPLNIGVIGYAAFDTKYREKET